MRHFEAEEAMEKAVDFMIHEFAAIRTGKASPALVENLDSSLRKLNEIKAACAHFRARTTPACYSAI
jgi:ribosome recycling factor